MKEYFLKNFYRLDRISTPESIYDRSKKFAGVFKQKIHVARWYIFSQRVHMAVWPYSPISSAFRGAFKEFEYGSVVRIDDELKELQRVNLWKWEYYHEHGEAKKIGKKGGLYIYGEDPLMLPNTLILLTHFLIFHTDPSFFTGLEEINHDFYKGYF